MANQDFINSPKAFLGRGWAFPPTFVKGDNALVMSEAEQNIKDNLFILISTTVGERIMRPDYGSSFKKLIYEPIDTTFATYITDQIRNAVLYFEPRIRLDDVEYEQDAEGGKVNVKINFTIKGNNTRSNIVYPFYLIEGTDVRQ